MKAQPENLLGKMSSSTAAAETADMVAALQHAFSMQHITATEAECLGVAKFLKRLAPPSAGRCQENRCESSDPNACRPAPQY